MLTLVGLGVWDEGDVSVKGMDACRNADKVYCELYTAAWGGDLRKLGKGIGKEMKVIEREDVEDRSGELLEEARKRDVVLLVPGDPLVATTHIHLLTEAEEKGVRVEVIHSSSVYTAVARTGLQIYKFGRTATVITPEKGYESEGFYDALKGNKERGMHTLLLLDVGMGTKKGLSVLRGIEKRRGEGVLGKVVLCSRLGSGEEKIFYGKAGDLAGTDLPPPAVVIVPGELHFMEKEVLEKLHGP